MRTNDHLSSADLAAFIAGGLNGAARTAAEAHLSACRACRRALVAEHESAQPAPRVPSVPPDVTAQVRRLVPTERPRILERPQPIEQSRSSWPQLLAAAAAVIAVVMGWVILRDGAPGAGPSAPVVRTGEVLSIGPTLIEPAAGARVAATVQRFRWSQVPDAIGYTVIVLDEQGDIVGEARANEAQLAVTIDLQALMKLPATDSSPPPIDVAATRYWYVCAQQSVGEEACSPISPFVID